MTAPEGADGLRARFFAQYERLAVALPQIASLRRSVDPPTLEFTNAVESTRVAEIGSDVGGRRTIRISELFVADLEEEIASLRESLVEACLSGIAEQADLEVRNLTAACLFDFAISFLLMHELHHLLGGHIEAFGTKTAAGFGSCDESAFGLPTACSSRPPEEHDALHRRYYLELESDDTALQVVMQASALSFAVAALTTRLERTPDTATQAVFESYDDARLVLFRAALASFWTMIGMLERRQPSGGSRDASTHPLPAARLLAGVCTIAEQFAELRANIGVDGMKSCVLGEDEAAAIQTFARSVLGPILRVSLRVGGNDAPAGLREVAFLRELGATLTNKHATTPFGAELIAIQRLRPRMTAILRVHRYFEG